MSNSPDIDPSEPLGSGSAVFANAMVSDLGIGTVAPLRFVDDGELASCFAVTDFAAASVAAAGLALAELISVQAGNQPSVIVDRRLTALWFGLSIRPIGWSLPAAWDSIAGDYRAADGWIRLHTNAPHHRLAALAVLGVPGEKATVEREVTKWKAEDLEAAVVANHGCAAAMHFVEEWAKHPQGECINREPLLATRQTEDQRAASLEWTPSRPLKGIRVLDLTRVLAGPVATRFLAGLGAEVLRIDPPTWDEPAVVPEMTLGKRCARLDLGTEEGRKLFLELLRGADILVHGYRSDALAGLGFDEAKRREVRPGLIDVALDAYGWTGPWQARRGFDSLVQMSSGIADAGMKAFGKDRPMPLPVQALDHATGYLLAAMALKGLTERLKSRRGFEGRTSLARVAKLLTESPAGHLDGTLNPPTDADYSPEIEASDFGSAQRLKSPVTVSDVPIIWDRPAVRLGSSTPVW